MSRDVIRSGTPPEGSGCFSSSARSKFISSRIVTLSASNSYIPALYLALYLAPLLPRSSVRRDSLLAEDRRGGAKDCVRPDMRPQSDRFTRSRYNDGLSEPQRGVRKCLSAVAESTFRSDENAPFFNDWRCRTTARPAAPAFERSQGGIAAHTDNRTRPAP